MSTIGLRNCLDRIKDPKLNLNDFFIGKNSQGQPFLREKTFFDKYFKCFSNRTNVALPDLVASAVSMLEAIKSNNNSESGPTALKICDVVRKVLKAGNYTGDEINNGEIIDFFKLDNEFRNPLPPRTETRSRHLIETQQTAPKRNPQTSAVTTRVPLDTPLAPTEAPKETKVPSLEVSKPAFSQPIHNEEAQQIHPLLAQISSYRNLFTADLQPRQNELPECFRARKEAQDACKALLRGEPISVEEIVTKLNSALAAMNINWRVHLEGGLMRDAFMAIVTIFTNHTLWSLTDFGIRNAKKSLEQWQAKNSTTELPKVLRVVNSGFGCKSQIHIGKATYQLQTIEGSSFLYPSLWARKENGQFIKHHNASNHTSIAEDKEAAQLLSQNEGWNAAHYVQVEG